MQSVATNAIRRGGRKGSWSAARRESEELVMSKEEARYQSLASCGATVVAFVGLCHEVAGHIIFPWGPAFLGGPIGWHGVGLFAITSGLLLLGGTLRVIPFPVVPFALFGSAIGVFFVVATAVLHREFHVFALAVVLAGLLIAYCHPKAEPTEFSRSARAAAAPQPARG
jgi:hypothetical protein